MRIRPRPAIAPIPLLWQRRFRFLGKFGPKTGSIFILTTPWSDHVSYFSTRTLSKTTLGCSQTFWN